MTCHKTKSGGRYHVDNRGVYNINQIGVSHHIHQIELYIRELDTDAAIYLTRDEAKTLARLLMIEANKPKQPTVSDAVQP